MMSKFHSYFAKKSNIVSLIIVLAVMVGSTGYLYYRHEKKMIQQERERDLDAIASLKATRISDWYLDQIHDTEIIAHSIFLQQWIRDWLTLRSPDRQASLLRYLREICVEHDFESILLTSADGELLLSSSAEITELDSLLIRNIHRVVATDSVVVSDFYNCKIHYKINIDFILPITNDSAHSGVVIVFKNNAEKFLFPLIQFWPGLSKSSETLLVRQEGDSVLFLNELRHRENTALNLRIALTETDVPAVQVVLGYRGIWRGVDYRGVKVLADIRPIEFTPWFMIAKTDQSELFAELKNKAFFTILFTSLTVLFVIAGLAFLYTFSQRNVYRALYQSQEEFHVTLQSIGDAVITTDHDGKVKYLNPVAEQLTGWNAKRAIGKPLEKVFRIINENSRQIVKSPVDRVLKEGLIVGLANHTLLISRNGTEIPIADSGAPLRDEKGTIIGVVLVFRDQSAEREAQRALRESEEKFRLIADNSIDCLWQLDTRLRFTYLSPALFRITGFQPEEWIGTRISEHTNWTEFMKMGRLALKMLRNYKTFDHVTFETRMYNKEHQLIPLEIVSKPLVLNGHLKGLQGATRDIRERREAQLKLQQSEARFRLLAESAPVGIVISDSKQKTLYVSPQFTALFGYSIEDMPGVEQWWSLAYPDQELRDKIRSSWNAAVEKAIQTRSEIEPMEAPVKCKDGTMRQIEFRLASNGELNFVIFTDITDRKKAEQNLLEKIDELERFNRIMVGRENRMVEMKKEINELCRKLQLPERYEIRDE
ncbi:MAG: PAS domain S-box protein [Candidatus Marinimicrobia bacterium]|nr:PAS domain S-box protein [Candidatus Neomarinimicrobiota bacterium]